MAKSFWVSLVLVIFMLTSTAVHAPRAGAVEPGEVSFMAATEDVIQFVRWTSDGTNLLGSATIFTPSTNVRTGGEAEQLDFTGLAAGDAVTLQFARDGSTVSGRVDGDALYISRANNDGGFTEVRYDRATEDEYEALVAGHARVAQAAMLEREVAWERDKPVVRAPEALAKAIDDMEWLLEYVPEAPEQDFREKKRRGESGSPTKWAVAEDLKRDARRLKVSSIRAERAKWGVDSVKGSFGWQFESPYRIYFCKSTAFAPKGGVAERWREGVRNDLETIAMVRRQADALEAVIASNPDASPPNITPSEGRSKADQYEARVVRTVQDWRETVALAVALRKEAREAFLTARRKFKQAGVKVPDCRHVVWGPGI